MPHHTQNVVQALAQHLGVPAREIMLAHDLYRDWGLTPLSLVVVLLDLERSVALELPSEQLAQVRTVGDLVSKFRSWLHDSEAQSAALVPRRARVSRNSQSKRRIRRELHHLRWLERDLHTAPPHALRPAQGVTNGAARRVASR